MTEAGEADREAALATALAALVVVPVQARAMPKAASADAASTRADAAFRKLADRFIAAYTRLNPTEATKLGEHRWDDRLPDISAAGRAAISAPPRRFSANSPKASAPWLAWSCNGPP